MGEALTCPPGALIAARWGPTNSPTLLPRVIGRQQPNCFGHSDSKCAMWLAPIHEPTYLR